MSNFSSPLNEQFSTTDSWRVFRIISEFVDGFENMTNIGPSVSIFGSARLTPGSIYYNLAIQASEAIASKGFAIITGGGPGLMEAANKGAQLARGGASCGLSVDLPHESSSNSFIDPKYNLRFRYFFIRKVMFIRYAQGFVFLPGGYGTLDEMFEALTLIQTKKIHPFPIYLIGKSYWTGLMDWIQETVLSQGCVSRDDLKLLQITDDPEEVANGIERHFQRDRAEKNF
ncbi:hypothetical protein PHSC3_000227 [Chlamydiales bacterium STE3]|nr:hypothetical protein PHSC3_000227 [Chlamydiales bacterium STE3]